MSVKVESLKSRELGGERRMIEIRSPVANRMIDIYAVPHGQSKVCSIGRNLCLSDDRFPQTPIETADEQR